VVAAPHARVQGHDQPVVTGHPGHLQQQVPPQGHRLGPGRLAGQGGPVGPGGLGRLERVGADVDVAVVGGDGAVLDEGPAPRLQRRHEAGVVPGVDLRHLAEAAHRVPPAGLGRLEVAVGPERRDDPPRPGRVGGQRGVGRQVVGRVVGGGQHLDAEPLVQRPWTVAVGGQPVGNLVVDRVGRLGRGAHRHAEDVGQLRLQPEADRRAPVGVPMAAQQPPHLARLGLRQRAAAHAQGVQRNPAGVQQPGHVVVGRHQQARRIGERLVVEQQPRVDVAVRREDRQVAHGVVQPPGDRPRPRVRWQQPVRVEPERGRGGGHALMVGAPCGRGNWLPVVAARHCPGDRTRSRLGEAIRTAGG
jgi:hypothetical protein